MSAASSGFKPPDFTDWPWQAVRQHKVGGKVASNVASKVDSDDIPAKVDLPASVGAYALQIRLDRALRIPVKRLGEPTLKAGLYLYVGSAYGPGGIASRVGRHLRRTKKIHWHVDHLTAEGRVTALAVFSDGIECELLERALQSTPKSYNIAVPVAGLGSSDCRRCPSHLLRLK